MSKVEKPQAAKAVKPVHDIGFTEARHRMAVGFLIAGQGQTVEGQGVIIRGGQGLFHEAAKDPDLNFIQDNIHTCLSADKIPLSRFIKSSRSGSSKKDIFDPPHNDMVQRSRGVYVGYSGHVIQVSNKSEYGNRKSEQRAPCPIPN